MADCDVLPKSVVAAIKKFQQQGGVIIGDGEICPAIKPDLVMPRFARTKRAAEDRKRLQAAAVNLRRWLDARYSRAVDSSNFRCRHAPPPIWLDRLCLLR